MAYHDEYVDLISAAIDGALSPADRARLDQHLAQCPDCKALCDDLNRIHQTLLALPTVEVPAGLSERIITAVQADNVTPITLKKPATQWKRWAATAAVLALILAGAGGMGLLTGRDSMTPAPEAALSSEVTDPVMVRSLPQVPVATTPAGNTHTGTEDHQGPDKQDAVTTQGVAPVSTAEPTLYVVLPTPEPVEETTPAEAPEGNEENPSNFMGNPFTLAPIMTVPPTPTIDDGQEETPEIGVMSVGLELELTEAELSAMERLRLYLELPEDYVWENPSTALWADGETVLRLTYLGLDSTEQCHMFDFSGTSILYLVPVDGGEIITAQP